MALGFFLAGLFMGPLMIPNMPEMMHATRLAHPDSDLDYANSLLAGIFNSCLGVGMAAGPLIGSALY